VENDRKELFWISSSKKDLCNVPDDGKQVMGFALDIAQCGYIVRFEHAVYVLHASRRSPTRVLNLPGWIRKR